MTTSIPPVAVLISHHVADFDTWKKAFDAHEPMRKEVGCLGHEVLRDADDANVVYVYCPAMDVKKISVFLDSPDLKMAMKKAGVERAPVITLMTPKSDDSTDEKLPGLIARHEVKDYRAWRRVYDELEKTRQQRGIIGHAVNQVFGNPKQVVVYHQARDLGTLRAFGESTELKQAMERGGVVGAPDVHFVRSVDVTKY